MSVHDDATEHDAESEILENSVHEQEPRRCPTSAAFSGFARCR